MELSRCHGGLLISAEWECINTLVLQYHKVKAILKNMNFFHGKFHL